MLSYNKNQTWGAVVKLKLTYRVEMDTGLQMDRKCREANGKTPTDAFAHNRQYCV